VSAGQTGKQAQSLAVDEGPSLERLGDYRAGLGLSDRAQTQEAAHVENGASLLAESLQGLQAKNEACAPVAQDQLAEAGQQGRAGKGIALDQPAEELCIVEYKNNRGAGFPGQLQQLKLTVTYNPSHEENTTVTGDASLHVPAHAGLRLFVRGSLGVGIPIVSASAGLEIGGSLGLEGALDAGVHVEWSPAKGLDLKAKAGIFVEPKLKFDITGFVLVEADLLLTTIEIYSKRWQLAAFEYGSGLRFGVAFPIHYQEGHPFDLSLDDVEFTVPKIDPGALLTGLIKKIA